MNTPIETRLNAMVASFPGGLRLAALALAATFFGAASPHLRAEQILLEDIQIFDGGLFIDGNVKIVNRRVVASNPTAASEVKKITPDPAGSHTLELTDGSQIHGTLVSLGRSEIVWKRSDATAPLHFDPAEVKRLDLGAPEKFDEKKGGATLKLDTAGWLVGELTGMNEGKFQLKVGDGAVLDVDRERVEWLSLNPTAAPPDAYDGPVGPMGLSGWNGATEPGGAWDYADGALVAKTAAPLSRNIPVLPEKADIEFTAGDGGSTNRGFTFWLRPGSNSARGYTKGTYYVRFQASTVNVNFYTGAEMKNFSANIQAEDGAKNSTRYRLLMDRKAGRLIVLANGKQIADWDLPEDNESPPSANIVWQPNYVSSNMAWTLANVRIRPWDGSTTPDAKGDEEGKDLIQSDSVPRIAGRLEGIEPESVNFSGEKFSRKGPLFIRLFRKDAPESAGSPIARVSLASRSQFDVTGIGFKDDTLHVRTSFGGDLKLPVGAVHFIEFPHKATLSDKLKNDRADLLVFKNGDMLRGKFAGAGQKKPIEWKPLKGVDSIQFEQSNVAGILLAKQAANRPDDAAHVADSMVVRFQNGDWLPGALISLDGTNLRMKTSSANAMKIAKSDVRTLYFGSAGKAPVWDGSSGRDEWISGADVPGFASGRTKSRDGAQDPWMYLDGAYTLTRASATRSSSRGPNIGRTLDGLPKKVDVSFSINTNEGSAGYSVQLFFDENKPGFMIQGSWDSAYIYDMSPRQQGVGFFNRPEQIEFGNKVGSEGNRRTFRFLADRETGQIWMYVNGEFVGTLGRKRSSEPSNPKTGTGIAIMPRPMRSQVTISDIWIAPWTGVLPSPSKIAPKSAAVSKAADGKEDPSEKSAPTPGQDVVSLANGDATAGSVIEADAETLKLLCEIGEIEIPINRAVTLEFPEKANPAPKGIRFRFVEKGMITADSFVIEDGNVTCSSRSVGTMTFPLSAVSEIIWTEQRPEIASDGKSEDESDDSNPIFFFGN